MISNFESCATRLEENTPWSLAEGISNIVTAIPSDKEIKKGGCTRCTPTRMSVDHMRRTANMQLSGMADRSSATFASRAWHEFTDQSFTGRKHLVALMKALFRRRKFSCACRQSGLKFTQSGVSAQPSTLFRMQTFHSLGYVLRPPNLISKRSPESSHAALSALQYGKTGSPIMFDGWTRLRLFHMSNPLVPVTSCLAAYLIARNMQLAHQPLNRACASMPHDSQSSAPKYQGNATP